MSTIDPDPVPVPEVLTEMEPVRGLPPDGVIV
jgi:hypothetical protein